MRLPWPQADRSGVFLRAEIARVGQGRAASAEGREFGSGLSALARCRCLLGLVDDKESFRTLLSAPSVCVGWTRSCPGASLSETHANKVLTLAPREQSLNVSLSFHHHGNRCERAVTLPIAAPVVGLG